MLFLAALAVWLGFVDGILNPVSLSSQVLGLSFLLLGILVLGAAVALLSRLAIPIWPQATVLGGVLAAYIALSLALRIADERLWWCIAIAASGAISVAGAGIAAYDIATDKATKFGPVLKGLVAGVGSAITLAQLWYTAIYQPNSAVAGINVTPRAGTLHAVRHGVGLLPVSISVRNDSSYEVVVLNTWLTLRASRYTPRRKQTGGPLVLPKAAVHSSFLQLGPFLPAPYYLAPDASVSWSSVIGFVPRYRPESFTLYPDFAYVRASEPGFDKLVRDNSATQARSKASPTNHCYATATGIYHLHEGELQWFAHGDQVLVTDVCLPRVCPHQQDKTSQACLIAKVVSSSSGDIRGTPRNASDARIMIGQRIQTFLAH
jgi:hypothetical protein